MCCLRVRKGLRMPVRKGLRMPVHVVSACEKGTAHAGGCVVCVRVCLCVRVSMSQLRLCACMVCTVR